MSFCLIFFNIFIYLWIMFLCFCRVKNDDAFVHNSFYYYEQFFFFWIKSNTRMCLDRLVLLINEHINLYLWRVLFLSLKICTAWIKIENDISNTEHWKLFRFSSILLRYGLIYICCLVQCRSTSFFRMNINLYINFGLLLI